MCLTGGIDQHQGTVHNQTDFIVFMNVRCAIQEIDFDTKLDRFAELGFSAIQFHDDDAVPNINDYTEEEIKQKARELKKKLDQYNLAAEFVAPRLWMDERTADGGFMSTSEKDRVELHIQILLILYISTLT